MAKNEKGLRVPPYSEEAEMGLLGSILLEPMVSLGRAQGVQLRPDMFYDRRHQLLFNALVDMARDGRAMDGLTIADWLKDRNEMEMVGGFDYLLRLQAEAGVAAHVEHYAQIVVEKSLRRSVVAQATALIDDAYSGELDGHELVRTVPARFTQLAAMRQGESNQEVLDRWYARMEDIKKGIISNGLPLPWPSMDKMMCGLEPGLILVGARPSCGKTTLEVNIADFLAREGCPVARACLDMSKEALLVRSVMRESRVSLPRMKYGYARWSQISTVKECKDLVAGWPFHVIEDGTLDGICSAARMLKLKHDIELLTVDFAQLVTTGNGHLDANMNALLGLVTKQLKALAFELDIPVLLLSQLSRGSDKDARRPKLSDLRDSGNLEQNATQVILMSKAKPEDYEAYDQSTNPEPLSKDVDRRILRGLVVDLAKNQQGEIGALEMWLRPNYFRIEEAEPEFTDLHAKLGQFTRETNADEVCDPNEEAVCDGDDEVEIEA